MPALSASLVGFVPVYPSGLVVDGNVAPLFLTALPALATAKYPKRYL